MTGEMFCDPTGHDWQVDPVHGSKDEGLTCARCGVTEAELERMEGW